jgi:hypothetical protein
VFAGVDHLLFPELVASEVPVTNAKGLFSSSLAEYAIMVRVCARHHGACVCTPSWCVCVYAIMVCVYAIMVRVSARVSVCVLMEDA